MQTEYSQKYLYYFNDVHEQARFSIFRFAIGRDCTRRVRQFMDLDL